MTMHSVISRREFLKQSAKVGSAMVLAGCSSGLHKSYKPTQKLPNIVYVLPDQWRGQAVGFEGLEPVITPNVDKFSKEALVLTNMASNYPVCVPYRTMMVSGQYPHTNGVLTNCFVDGKEMPDNKVWWTDILAQKGYSLGYCGKWHITKPFKNKYQGKDVKYNWLVPAKRHGFSYWYILNSNNHMKCPYVSSEWQSDYFKKINRFTPEYDTDRAIDFIKNKSGKYRDPDKPFVLMVPYNPPHMAYHTYPKKYDKLYKNVDVEELCRNYPDVPPADSHWGKYYRKNIKGYYRLINGVDEQFGRLLACLKEEGLDDNTIVIFTSDHGNCLGRHNKISKNNHYEESMHVPFMIRWPGKIKPRKDDVLMSVPDIYPTLLELLGFKDATPAEVQGVSHANLFLSGQGPRPTSQLYIFIPVNKPQWGRRGVRTHRYTLMIEKMPGKATITVLHDNKQDSYQMKNIADQRPDIVKKLTEEELIPWLKKTNDPWLKV